LELQELRHILTKATTFFDEQDQIQNNDGLGNTVSRNVSVPMEGQAGDRSASALRLGSVFHDFS